MKNIYKILLAAAGFGLLGVAAIFLLPRPEKVLAPLPEPPACGVDHEMFVIRGDSLAPQFAAGQEVKLFFDYYDCHPLAAGDAVAYRWAGNKDAPIAKIVKAVAGDHWRMEPVSEQNAYQIEVNGQWLANSAGELYQIPEKKAKLLLHYADSYPEIPEGALLILGNIAQGSDDSVRFGLAAQENIIGKIEP